MGSDCPRKFNVGIIKMHLGECIKRCISDAMLRRKRSLKLLTNTRSYRTKLKNAPADRDVPAAGCCEQRETPASNLAMKP